MNNNLLLLFLGAFLTFLATITVEVLKNVLISNNNQNRYKTYARLQLTAVLNVLSRLKYSYESNSRYLPRDIGLLSTAMDPLNSLRMDNTILRKSNFQEKLIELVAELNLYIADIKDLSAGDPRPPQSQIDDEDNPGVEEQSAAQKIAVNPNKWLEKNIELIDLRRRCEELIRNLS